MTTPADDIAVTQLRNRLDQAGDMVASAVRDAYARGLAEGLRRARADQERQPTSSATCSQCGQPWSVRAWGLGCSDVRPGACIVDDAAERRPTTV